MNRIIEVRLGLEFLIDFKSSRMAMSAAVLSTVLWRAAVRDPFVVSKSYPSFWKDLANAGFSVRELES